MPDETTVPPEVTPEVTPAPEVTPEVVVDTPVSSPANPDVTLQAPAAALQIGQGLPLVSALVIN
jgi:hypothetical protein